MCALWGRGVALLCKLIMGIKCQQPCWGPRCGPEEGGATVGLPRPPGLGLGAGGCRAPVRPTPARKHPRAPRFGLDKHHGFRTPSCHSSCQNSPPRLGGLSFRIPHPRKQAAPSQETLGCREPSSKVNVVQSRSGPVTPRAAQGEFSGAVTASGFSNQLRIVSPALTPRRQGLISEGWRSPAPKLPAPASSSCAGRVSRRELGPRPVLYPSTEPVWFGSHRKNYQTHPETPRGKWIVRKVWTNRQTQKPRCPLPPLARHCLSSSPWP